MTASPESRVPSPEGGRGPVRRGAIYASKFAIRSLIRSETDTAPIKPPATNPEPSPAPKNATMDTITPTPAAQEQVKLPAAVEVAVAQKAQPPRVRRKGRVFLPVLVATLTGLLVATGYLVIRAPREPNGVGRWGTAGTGAEAAATPLGSADPFAAGVANPFGTPAPELPGVPTRLKVKAIGIDTPLEALHLGKGDTLQPPKDFAKAGWYADGTVPGDLGPAVIAGHVDNKQGPAVFYRLRELEAGDHIEVVRGGKTVRFTVTSTAWYPKTTFPTVKVYGPTPDSQLRLITCGGVFDHRLRSYKDNLVVYAVAG